MGITRRKFTLEFKIEAAHRVIDTGRTIAEVAAELSVVDSVLARWVRDERRRMETAAGAYPRVRAPEGKGFSAQDFFIRLAEGRDSIEGIPEPAWEPETVVTAPEPAVSAKPKRRKADRKHPEPIGSQRL